VRPHPAASRSRCSRRSTVNGSARTPLYTWLTEQGTKPAGPSDIKWNFAKFLVDRRGNIVARFDPKTSPTAPDVRQAIEGALS
jgi:glutathione peroxidase